MPFEIFPDAVVDGTDTKSSQGKRGCPKAGHLVEKEMATHSRILAWRIPGTAERGGLPSMGSQSRTRLKRLSSSSRSEKTLSGHVSREPHL